MADAVEMRPSLTCYLSKCGRSIGDGMGVVTEICWFLASLFSRPLKVIGADTDQSAT